MSSPTAAFADTSPSERLHGPDVVRAVALIGVVVMNYHGYLILRGGRVGDGWIADLLDPWNSPFATRFAATFVLVAGVGVTLLTRRARCEPALVAEMRWRLARRGMLLYVVGLLLDEIWPGTIIPYYGVMFVLAAAIFTWRSRWIIAIGFTAAIAGTSLRLWRFDRQQNGHATEWLSAPGLDSIRYYVFDVMINGTHPLLPWFAFFCAGIVLGRILPTKWWRPAALATGGVLLFVAATAAAMPTSDLGAVAVSLDPRNRSLAYVANALGVALVAYAVIDWLAGRFPTQTDPLRRAGQLTLSLYLAHVVVFNLLVDWLGWVKPAGFEVAIVFASIFWVAAIVGGTWWQRRFGRGPAEYVYRAFGA